MKHTIINWLITSLAVGTLVGCGGGANTASSSGSKLLATTSSTPAGPAGFTYCASENGTCSFSGMHEVAYGANGTFYYKTVSGSTGCNNTVFGDPTPGVTKACFYQTSISSGTVYRLVAQNSGLALDVTGAGTADGTNVEVWTNNGEGSNAQRWQANQNSDGSFTLINPNSGKALDDAGANPNNGANVQIATVNGSTAQEWNVMSNSDGTYTLINVNANKALDVYNAGTTAGTNVEIWASNGGANQKWYLVPFNTGSTSTGTWNGNTTFSLMNNTHATYTDNQVYWAIIGKDWNTGQFVWVNTSGQLVPMSTADNGALIKNGQTYSNYFHSLAQSKSVTIPPINSARMFMSVGTPMYIKVVADANGNIGYAGPNIENPTDPNIDVYFDFIEMAINRPTDGNPGIYANTTRVDQFGFPVLMRVQGLGGFDQTVGETETRSALLSEYQSEVPNEFKGLGQAPYAPYRIIAPAHASFNSGGANGTYMDGYVNTIWDKYTTQNLTFTDQQGTFTGHVVNGQFQFSDGIDTVIVNKPTTPMVLLGNGTLNDSTGTTPGTSKYAKQLQTQAQLCAALNRHIMEDPAHWYTQSYHYLSAPANYYAKFWHDHGVNNLSYGFSYDDVGGFSPSIHTTAPTTVTVTVGW